MNAALARQGDASPSPEPSSDHAARLQRDSLKAYQLSKCGNALRVMAEAVRWGQQGARINAISSGIIITPLAKDELTGPLGAGYRRMIDLYPAKRAGTPDEIANVAALLMGSDGGFITGSDFLTDAASRRRTGSANSRRMLSLVEPPRRLTACIDRLNPPPRAGLSSIAGAFRFRCVRDKQQ